MNILNARVYPSRLVDNSNNIYSCLIDHAWTETFVSNAWSEAARAAAIEARKASAGSASKSAVSASKAAGGDVMSRLGEKALDRANSNGNHDKAGAAHSDYAALHKDAAKSARNKGDYEGAKLHDVAAKAHSEAASAHGSAQEAVSSKATPNPTAKVAPTASPKAAAPAKSSGGLLSSIGKGLGAAGRFAKDVGGAVHTVARTLRPLG